MGKILDLYNLPPKEFEKETAKLLASSQAIGVYSPEEFTVMYGGEVVTIAKGFHKYAPGFAVWLVQKYGPKSTYGKTYRTVKKDGKEISVPNPVLLDYNPEQEQKQPESLQPKQGK
jgi:hypothetical protein